MLLPRLLGGIINLLKLSNYYYYVLMCGLILCVVVVLGATRWGTIPYNSGRGSPRKGIRCQLGRPISPGRPATKRMGPAQKVREFQRFSLGSAGMSTTNLLPLYKSK